MSSKAAGAAGVVGAAAVVAGVRFLAHDPSAVKPVGEAVVNGGKAVFKEVAPLFEGSAKTGAEHLARNGERVAAGTVKPLTESSARQTQEFVQASKAKLNTLVRDSLRSDPLPRVQSVAYKERVIRFRATRSIPINECIDADGLDRLSAYYSVAAECRKQLLEVEQLSILSLFPEDTVSFHKVYGPKAECAHDELEALQRFQRQMAESIAGWTSLGGQTSPQDLAARIRECPSDRPIVILAHSEGDDKVRTIPTPWGEPISLAQLKRFGEESGHEVILVSCHSPDLRLTREISLKEAVTICQIGLGATVGRDATALRATMANAAVQLEAERNDRTRTVLIEVTLLTGGSAGITTLPGDQSQSK